MNNNDRGKWIAVESTSVAAAEVARQALEVRTGYVMRLLPLAAHEFQKDVEYVHQLRVGSRRAAAAWQAFRPLMQGKPKALRRWLRRIRRAAGPARDADVLLARLKKEYEHLPGLEYVLVRLDQQRLSAQQALVEVEAKSQSGKLNRALQRCLDSLHGHHPGREDMPFQQFARTALLVASQELFELTGLDQATVAQLHKLRIAGKRLRYSIELFHAAFPANLRREVYPQVEKLQNQLGRLNDHVTAQALFQTWLASMPTDDRAATLARLIAEEHDAARHQRKKFLQWWTSRRAASVESQLRAQFGTVG